MSWRLVIRPRARRDIAQSVDWYNSQAPGLGDEFLDAFSANLENIRQNPYQYQALRSNVRRAVMRRFPLLIVYAVEDDLVVIARCVHGRSDPRRWMRRGG